jgi:Golgi apparatus protein 1
VLRLLPGTLCLALSALAQGNSVCKADAARLCPGLPPAGGRLGQCLASHTDALSADCRALVTTMTAEMKEIHDACAADEKAYCAQVTPGQGHLRACLGEHAMLLSASCHTALSKLRSPDACHDDMAKLCPQFTPGDGHVLGCLKDHESELTEACRRQTTLLKATLEEMDKACDLDAQTLCPDTAPGQGRLLACLQAHTAKLSPACKAMFQR